MTEGPTNPEPAEPAPAQAGSAEPARVDPVDKTSGRTRGKDGSGGGPGLFAVGGRAPVEIRLSCTLLITGALLFVLVDVLRVATEPGNDRAFLLPLLQLVIAVGVTGGLLRGMRSARLFGMLFVLTVALVHMLIALQPTLPVWVRILSGVIAATQVYVAVLLNTRPALLYSGGARGVRR